MATISFTVPDAIVPDLVEALEVRFGRLGGETDAEMVRRHTRAQFWRPLVNQQRKDEAAAAAPATTGPDFGTN